jgi:hypothetical protein
MAKKSISKKKNVNKLSFAVHPLTFALLMSVVVGFVGGMAFLFGANAAPAMPTGSFISETPVGLKAGDTFTSEYQVSAIKGQAYTYQRLVCWHDQGAGELTVVKQESSRENPKTWQLVKSESNQIPAWNTSAEAQCQLDLVYRIDKNGGKNGSTIETIATQSFTVAPSQ